MNIDYIVLVSQFIIPSVLLLLFIPKDKIREAVATFLFKLAITWLVGLTVVERGLLEYPFRAFPNATRASFAFEYFAYPALCALFVTNFPHKKRPIGQLMYYVYYCTTITVIEVIVEKYTNIIKYISWNWFITWLTLFITFYFSRRFNLWFFKIEEKT